MNPDDFDQKALSVNDVEGAVAVISSIFGTPPVEWLESFREALIDRLEAALAQPTPNQEK